MHKRCCYPTCFINWRTLCETVKCGEIVRELKYTVFALEREDYYTWVNFFVCVGANNRDYILGDFEGLFMLPLRSSTKISLKRMKLMCGIIWIFNLNVYNFRRMI